MKPTTTRTQLRRQSVIKRGWEVLQAARKRRSMPSIPPPPKPRVLARGLDTLDVWQQGLVDHEQSLVDEMKKMAFEDHKIIELTSGKEIVKVIAITGKLVNIVVKQG